MRRKKILFVGEFSGLATGYATYHRHVIQRLYATHKYEIAEFGSYCFYGDSRVWDFPWKIYGNMPHPENHPEIEKYNANPLTQFGSWRFEEVCLDFQPDIVCVPPGEIVMTEDGYKNIEDIKVGEKVLTHKNRFKPVVRTMKNPHEGSLYSIKANGCAKPLKLTGNHPVLVFRKRKQTNQKKSIKKIYDGVEPEFIPADQVKVGDLAVLSSPKYNKSLHLDISGYLDNFVEKDGFLYPPRITNTNPIPKIVNIDKELARLVGYIIGDGYIANSGIRITFNKSEERFVDDSVRLFKEIFGLDATVRPYKEREAYDVIVNSILLSEFFGKWSGFLKKKFIPKHFWYCSQEIKESLLSGLIRSDGCYKRNTVSFSTVSKKLANEFRILCTSVGIPVNLQFRKQAGKNGSYDIEGYGESASSLHNCVNKHKEAYGTVVDAVRRPRSTHIVNGYLVSSISKIRKEVYSGQVYNLEVVDDHSYVVGQNCVHNCDIRDFWMLNFENTSPFRPLFHWAIMPTVDSAPQDEQWIDTFLDADAVATYTDFGMNTLHKQSGGLIKLIGSTPPGADIETYKPFPNRAQFRQQMGFGSDVKIIGTVMRNQKRKLFPDLFNAFKEYLEVVDEKTAQNTFLYCHTSYPDNGWDLPRLIKETGIGHKVLFTYYCPKCNNFFPSFFQDARTFCQIPGCGCNEVTMPSTNRGLSTEQLAMVYNLFDVYIQYAICEGYGMPAVEAAACGVPVMAVNYSGMEYVIDKTNGLPIKVQRMFREAETHAYRALPDNQDLIQKLKRFFSLPETIRLKKGWEARDGVLKNLTWERTASIWERYLDSVPLKDENKTWKSPPRLHEPATEVPQGLSNEQLVKWAIENVLGDTSKLNTYYSMRQLRDLNNGVQAEGFGGVQIDDSSFLGQRQRFNEYTPQHMLRRMYEECQARNYWEQRRVGMIQEPKPDYIVNAKPELELVNAT